MKQSKEEIELDKKKDELYQKIKGDINYHLQVARNNKNNMAKEEDERREDILFYENYKFNLAIEKDAGNFSKKQNSQNKTIENQKETESRMMEFKKIMNLLQEDSVKTKTDKERRQMGSILPICVRGRLGESPGRDERPLPVLPLAHRRGAHRFGHCQGEPQGLRCPEGVHRQREHPQ